MKHTKGPWKVITKGENFYGIQSREGNICILAAEYNKRIDKWANAELIAQAPDLAEVLAELLNALSNIDTNGNSAPHVKALGIAEGTAKRTLNKALGEV